MFCFCFIVLFKSNHRSKKLISRGKIEKYFWSGTWWQLSWRKQHLSCHWRDSGGVIEQKRWTVEQQESGRWLEKHRHDGKSLTLYPSSLRQDQSEKQRPASRESWGWSHWEGGLSRWQRRKPLRYLVKILTPWKVKIPRLWCKVSLKHKHLPLFKRTGASESWQRKWARRGIQGYSGNREKETKTLEVATLLSRHGMQLPRAS